MNGAQRPEGFPVYAWDDGWQMIRPLTEAGMLLHVTQFVLTNASSSDGIWWGLDGFGVKGLSVSSMEIILFKDPEPTIRHSSQLNTLSRIRSFYLDMLVPIGDSLNGDLLDIAYDEMGLPISVGAWEKLLAGPEFQKLERLSKEYHLDGEHRTEMLIAHSDIPGWRRSTEDNGSISFSASWSMSPLTGDHIYHLMFREFTSPDLFSLSRPEFVDMVGREWIIVDENSVVLGVGHTPMGAIKSVRCFVASKGSELGIQTLIEWEKKYTIEGKSLVDVSAYVLLGLGSPVGWKHDRFVDWIKSLEES